MVFHIYIYIFFFFPVLLCLRDLSTFIAGVVIKWSLLRVLPYDRDTDTNRDNSIRSHL